MDRQERRHSFGEFGTLRCSAFARIDPWQRSGQRGVLITLQAELDSQMREMLRIHGAAVKPSCRKSRHPGFGEEGARSSLRAPEGSSCESLNGSTKAGQLQTL